MTEFNWKEKFSDWVTDAKSAIDLIRPGFTVFIGTGCGQPQHLVRSMVEHSSEIYDVNIVHLLTMGTAPYVEETFQERFKMNSFFIADNVRGALSKGIGDYTPIFLSDIPALHIPGTPGITQRVLQGIQASQEASHRQGVPARRGVGRVGRVQDRDQPAGYAQIAAGREFREDVRSDAHARHRRSVGNSAAELYALVLLPVGLVWRIARYRQHVRYQDTAQLY